MSRLVTRAEWGARPPRNRSTNIRPSSCTAHYGGPSPWSGGIGGHDRCAGIVRSWQNFHMDGRGWADIAYNAVVCPHGLVFEGRGRGVRSAANGTNTGNGSSYAICYLAGDGDPLTDAAKVGFLWAAAWLGQPLTKVHSDWFATACPGGPLRDWVKAGAPSPVVAPAPPPAASPKGEPVFLIRAKDRREVYRTNLVTKTWVPNGTALAVDQVLMATAGLPTNVHVLDPAYVDSIPTTKG